MAQEDKVEWAGSVKELIGQVSERLERMEASRAREREEHEEHVQSLNAEIEELKEEKEDLRRRLEEATGGRQALRAKLDELREAMTEEVARWTKQLEAAREAASEAAVSTWGDGETVVSDEEKQRASNEHRFEETARAVSEQVSEAYQLVSRTDLPSKEKTQLASTLQYIEVLLQEEIDEDLPALPAPTPSLHGSEAGGLN